MKRILVVEEKHGTYYYDASTDEELGKAAAAILKSRYEQGYWYHEPQEPKKELTDEQSALLAMTDEQFDILPLSVSQDLKEKKNKLVRHLDYARIQYEQDRKWWDWLLSVVESDTIEEAAALTYTTKYKGVVEKHNLAFRLLDDRSDYEYQHVSLENLEDPEWG